MSDNDTLPQLDDAEGRAIYRLHYCLNARSSGTGEVITCETHGALPCAVCYVLNEMERLLEASIGGLSEFERFEKFTKAIVQVPKSEIDALRDKS